MRAEVPFRAAAQCILLGCIMGCAVAVGCQDWPDAVLVGLLGAFSAVTARKMTWQLRESPYTGTAVGVENP